MMLSHPFLESSTAEAVIQEAKPWFWGGSSPEIRHSTQPEWLSVALCNFALINLGLPSYLSQLLVKPLPILVLSPEYTFLVTPTLADIYFTTDVVFEFEGLSLKRVGWWSNLVIIIWIWQHEVYKDCPCFLQGGNWCRPV